MKYDISVLALGNWGTALANHLAEKGLNVLGWSIESEVVNSINDRGRHPFYQKEISICPRFEATTDLNRALNASRMWVLAFPSSALGEMTGRLMNKCTTQHVLVSAIKGMDESTLLTPLQHLSRYLKADVSTVVLSGPSFARDIIALRPSSLVAASNSHSSADLVAKTFSSKWMKIYTSNDPLGVELGGITKNVVALATGVCDGLGLGDSARAALVTRGLAEMMRLADAAGAKRITLSGLSGLGDLVLTSFCDTSRNRTVGLRLGRGEKLSDILGTLGSVAEGVKSAPLLLQLARKHQVEMPITEAVVKMLNDQISSKEMAEMLLARPMRSEFESD